MIKLEKEKVIDSFDVSENFRLKLCTGEFKGDSRLDLRLYIIKPEGNPDIPTKKGINFNLEWLDRFIKMTDKLKEL